MQNDQFFKHLSPVANQILYDRVVRRQVCETDDSRLLTLELSTSGPSKTFLEQNVIYVRQQSKLFKIFFSSQDVALKEYDVGQVYEGQMNAFFRGKYFEHLGGSKMLVFEPQLGQRATAELDQEIMAAAPFQFQEGRIFIAQFDTILSLDLQTMEIADLQLMTPKTTRIYQQSRSQLAIVTENGVKILNIKTNELSDAETGERAKTVRDDSLCIDGQVISSKHSTYKLSRPTVTNNVCYVTDFSGNLEVFTTQKATSFADCLSESSQHGA